MSVNRRRQEIRKILQTTLEAAPVTIEQLSTLVHASPRTIRYDLEPVAEELQQNGLRLCRQARKGIWLEPLSAVPATSSGSSGCYIMSPEERIAAIIVLLLDHELSSIDELADTLAVSRNTLLTDLKQVQKVLQKRHLCYESKRGRGIWIDGAEQDIRDMIVHIFAKDSYDFRLFEERQDKMQGRRHLFYGYMRGLPVKNVAEIFLDQLHRSDVNASGEAVNRMVLALLVQLKRLRQGKDMQRQDSSVHFVSDEGESLKGLAKDIASSLCGFQDKFHDEAEISYITKELLHSRIYRFREDSQKGDLHLQALQLAKQFIEYAQTWLGDIYLDDHELLYNLAMHLQPALERAQGGIVLTNPLLPQIRTQYQDLFDVALRAAAHIGQHMGIKLSDDEVGYLTIHLGAAVERHKMQKVRHLSVLLVCGNGIGTANLLAMTLRRHVPYLDVQQVLSAYELEEDALKDVDLVISTAPLDIPGKAVLRVSPILTDNEIALIEGQLRSFYHQKIRADKIQKTIAMPQQGLCDYLTVGRICFLPEVDDWQMAIRKAGALLQADGSVTAGYVEAMIRCVQELGPYIIVIPNVAMPHARAADGARRVAVSYVRLGKPVYFERENEKLPVDMIFSFSTIDEKAHLKLMDDLWHLFSDEQGMACLRRCQTAVEVIDFLQKWQKSGF